MNDEKEKKLLSLLEVRRPEAFWNRQRGGILAAAAAPRHRAAWMLVPAAAAAALLLMLLGRPKAPAPQPGPQMVSVSFLENLDMLADMDVLEAVPESEL